MFEQISEKNEQRIAQKRTFHTFSHMFLLISGHPHAAGHQNPAGHEKTASVLRKSTKICRPNVNYLTFDCFARPLTEDTTAGVKSETHGNNSRT
jgi:hypothetical protein